MLLSIVKIGRKEKVFNTDDTDDMIAVEFDKKELRIVAWFIVAGCCCQPRIALTFRRVGDPDQGTYLARRGKMMIKNIEDILQLESILIHNLALSSLGRAPCLMCSRRY